LNNIAAFLAKSYKKGKGKEIRYSLPALNFIECQQQIHTNKIASFLSKNQNKTEKKEKRTTYKLLYNY